jgi:cell division protein FtsB
MKRRLVRLVVGVVLSALIGVGLATGVRAQQMPMHQGPMGNSPMMMQQMQAQMAQMQATMQAMRAQLDKINPELLTGQERPMYEYLKIMQTHMEQMHAMMGTMMRMGMGSR